MRFLIAPIFALALLPVSASAQRVELCGDQVAQQTTLPTEKRPWVGVSVSAAPAALRHQLKVTDGIGLVVEFVQPKSPAADAGIKPFDLLLKLDDQWLVNPEQFAVLVRMHHSGDEVKLSFLHEGSRQTAAVKLVDHEFARLPDWEGDVAWPGAAPHDPHNEGAAGDHMAQRVLTWLDGHRQVSVTTTNDHVTLVVRNDETGRVLFDGPIDTEAQRKALPADIRDVLDSLSKVSAAFGGDSFDGGKQPPSKSDGGSR
jgi:hypothetical protein